MPLIISPEDATKWLSSETSTEELKSIIKPISSEQMKAHTIKKFISPEAKNINSEVIIAYYNYPDVSDFMNSDNTLF
jgi:putative SOS response-associated peptidase YedK